MKTRLLLHKELQERRPTTSYSMHYLSALAIFAFTTEYASAAFIKGIFSSTSKSGAPKEPKTQDIKDWSDYYNQLTHALICDPGNPKPQLDLEDIIKQLQTKAAQYGWGPASLKQEVASYEADIAAVKAIETWRKTPKPDNVATMTPETMKQFMSMTLPLQRDMSNGLRVNKCLGLGMAVTELLSYRALIHQKYTQMTKKVQTIVESRRKRADAVTGRPARVAPPVHKAPRSETLADASAAPQQNSASIAHITQPAPQQQQQPTETTTDDELEQLLGNIIDMVNKPSDFLEEQFNFVIPFLGWLRCAGWTASESSLTDLFNLYITNIDNYCAENGDNEYAKEWKEKLEEAMNTHTLPPSEEAIGYCTTNYFDLHKAIDAVVAGSIDKNSEEVQKLVAYQGTLPRQALSIFASDLTILFACEGSGVPKEQERQFLKFVKEVNTKLPTLEKITEAGEPMDLWNARNLFLEGLGQSRSVVKDKKTEICQKSPALAHRYIDLFSIYMQVASSIGMSKDSIDLFRSE